MTKSTFRMLCLCLMVVSAVCIAPPPLTFLNFEVANTSVTEDIGEVTFSVLRTGDLSFDIQFDLLDRSETADADDRIRNFTVPFTMVANEENANFSVFIVDDNLVESTESLIFVLAGSNIGIQLGSVREIEIFITDNDACIVQSYELPLTTNCSVGIPLMFDQACTFECAEGELVGNSTRTCQMDGTLSGNVTCVGPPTVTLQLDNEANFLWAGDAYNATCSVAGGIQPQTVTWFIGERQLMGGIETDNTDPNLSLSVLTFIPEAVDHMTYLSCRSSSGGMQNLFLRVLPPCVQNSNVPMSISSTTAEPPSPIE